MYPTPPRADHGPADTHPALVGLVNWEDTSCVDFSILQHVIWPGVLLSHAPFSLLLLPRRVVSSPRDQHFCCLCFWLYLRSPSFLLCPWLSCIREQLWPVVGLFHCISTSGVSFHSLQSTTMGFWRPEWPMLRVQSYRARSFCFARVNKNAKLKANPLMPSSNSATCLTSLCSPLNWL